MFKKICPIIFGNNQNNLFGSENDAILIYNLFYTFYIEDEKWNKPYLYINKKVRINKLIKRVNKIDTNNLVLIYFSGHSCKYGNLKFFNNFYSNEYILNRINKKFIYFIIDSCYSKKFIKKISLENILSIEYIVSCLDNQLSKEIIIKKNDINLKYKNLNDKNNIIVIGIFTYYFYKILLKNKTYDIRLWKNLVFKNNIWKIIEKKYNQTIYYNKLLGN